MIDCVTVVGLLGFIIAGPWCRAYLVTRVVLVAMMTLDALEHFKFDFVSLFSEIAFNGYHRLHQRLLHRYLKKPFHYKMFKAYRGDH